MYNTSLLTCKTTILELRFGVWICNCKPITLATGLALAVEDIEYHVLKAISHDMHIEIIVEWQKLCSRTGKLIKPMNL